MEKQADKSGRVFFFFLKPIQLLSLSPFHRFPPVSLPFVLLQPCFPLNETLVGNKKQAASEKMKVGRDRTEAGSEIALESASNA